MKERKRFTGSSDYVASKELMNAVMLHAGRRRSFLPLLLDTQKKSG